jgi:beta-mannanase
MNATWYPWGGTVNGNRSEEYVAAWKHVVDIFRAEGAHNVTWVWSPHTVIQPEDPLLALETFYPGDEYVDWVALDGYNWGSIRPAEGWRSFNDIFTESYQRLTSLTQKPVMIAETSSTELGGQKNTWYQEAIEVSLKETFPRIKAVVFFNLNKETDWRINSSPTALTQFRESLGTVPIANGVTVNSNKIIEPN